MQSEFNDIQYVDRPLNSWDSNIPDGPHVGIQAEEFQLALQDAKRAMAEDPMLKRPGLIGLPDDDLSLQPHFYGKSWDELELQTLSEDQIAKVSATSFDYGH